MCVLVCVLVCACMCVYEWREDRSTYIVLPHIGTSVDTISAFVFLKVIWRQPVILLHLCIGG